MDGKQTDLNKQIVRRFNLEVIQNGSREAFDALMQGDFANHSAVPPRNDKESMWNTFNTILRPGFRDLQVEIHDQVAEGDLVTTRKTIHGTHTGAFMGLPPTGKRVAIQVIDIVRLKDNRYSEHWGLNTFEKVLSELKTN